MKMSRSTDSHNTICPNFEHNNIIKKFVLIGLIEFTIKKVNKELSKPKQKN